MHLAPARSRRSAVTLLLGALLAALTLGLLCAGVNAGSGARAGAEAVHVVAPSVSAPDGGVGCGKKKDDQGGQPAAPTRGASAHEQLLSTLSYAHAGPVDGTAGGPFLAVPLDRGPPPRDPPSPVELSVLRV